MRPWRRHEPLPLLYVAMTRAKDDLQRQHQGFIPSALPMVAQTNWSPVREDAKLAARSGRPSRGDRRVPPGMWR
jgi:hypothetical protein